ncbi:MAG: ferritin, partial [Actinomycetota bacterium]|nr:ferritin [Actinomycetota bacterium]
MSRTSFVEKLREQVGNELAAHQQYIALAVWFDRQDLPQLARHFYRQSVEERNHG